MKTNAKGIVAAAIACAIAAGTFAGTALASPYVGYDQAHVAEETVVKIDEDSLAGEAKTYVRKDGSFKERNNIPDDSDGAMGGEVNPDGAMGGEGEF